MAILDALDGRTSLRETIAERLRGAIITGEMRPGQVYSAAALATDLGVSATPVREAMLTLAQEGMVEVARNKGFRVIELTDTDLDQITYLRRLIEVPAVAEIAAGLRHTEAAALRSAAEAIVKAADSSDLSEYLRADREFHLGLLALSGNDVLVQIVGDLRSRARLYGLRSLAQSGTLTSSADEHGQLLELVLAGDSEGARALMDHHIAHIRTTWAAR
ncbi:MAG: GntR family transcriptional regulator [Streptosporangiaceae bacterium]|jgi:DNA-binding GntR family transcriptional regulator